MADAGPMGVLDGGELSGGPPPRAPRRLKIRRVGRRRRLPPWPLILVPVVLTAGAVIMIQTSRLQPATSTISAGMPVLVPLERDGSHAGPNGTPTASAIQKNLEPTPADVGPDTRERALAAALDERDAARTEALRLQGELQELVRENGRLQALLARAEQELASTAAQRNDAATFERRLHEVKAGHQAELAHAMRETERLRRENARLETSLRTLAARPAPPDASPAPEAAAPPRSVVSGGDGRLLGLESVRMETVPVSVRHKRPAPRPSVTTADSEPPARTFGFIAQGFAGEPVAGSITVAVDPQGGLRSGPVQAIRLVAGGVTYTPANTTYVYDPAVDRLSVRGSAGGDRPGSFDLELRRASADRPGPNDFAFFSQGGEYRVATMTAIVAEQK